MSSTEDGNYQEKEALLPPQDQIIAGNKSDKPRIYFIRHGQSKHNEYQGSIFTWLTCRCWCCCPFPFRDARLTTKGISQVEQLRKKLISDEYSGLLDDIDVVFTSPLSRACETTKAFHENKDKDAKTFIVEPLLAELCKHPCDEGSEAEDLKKLFTWLDFTSIPKQWWGKGPKEKESDFHKRINKFIDLIKDHENVKNKKWKVICVVGHSTFIRTITGRPKLNNCCISGPHYLDDLKHITNAPPPITQCAKIRREDDMMQ